jgi:hypothetical protein
LRVKGPIFFGHSLGDCHEAGIEKLVLWVIDVVENRLVLSGISPRLTLVSQEPSTQQLEARIADLEQRLDAAVAAFENLLRNPMQEAPIRRELGKAKRKTWHSRDW